MFGFVYLFCILVLISFAIFYFINNQTIYREHARQNLSSIADLKVNSILEWRNNFLEDAIYLQKKFSADNEFEKYLKKPTDQFLKNNIFSIFSEMQSIHQYDSFILNKEGKIVFSFPQTYQPVNETVKNNLDKVDLTKSITFIDLYRDEIEQKIYLGYLIPIFKNASKQQMVSYVFLRIDPTLYLYPLLQKWPSNNKTAETLLVRKEGPNVLYLNDLKFLSNAALTKTISLTNTDTPAVQAVLGRIGYFEGYDYRGVPVVSELRAIPNSMWYMVARMDKSELFGPLYEKMRELIIYLLSIAILLGFIFLWIHFLQLKRWYREKAEYEKKSLELDEEVRLANEKANLYLSLVGSIIVVIEKDEKVSMINDAGCKLLGYSREEVLGKNWFTTFLVQTEIEKVREVFLQIMLGKIQPVEYFENQVVTKMGERLDIAWHNNLLKDKMGKIIGTVSSGEDITKQKHAFETISKLNEELEDKVRIRTQELEHSNHELEAFAYSVSHDLRAPLRSIDGYANMLMDEYFSTLDQEAIRILGVIRKSTHQMDQLIYDLLTMSKAIRAEIKLEKIDMGKMVDSIFSEIIVAQTKKDISYSVDPLPPCSGDPALIRQVWINLIDNAIKYSSKNPSQFIQIRGAIQEHEVCYSISDNGVGFNQAYQNKLFGPFQRLHSSEEFPGTGIGLAIVERIIRRHHGRVWAESKEGQGATFYFTLPNKH